MMVGFNGTELNRELMFLIDTLKVGGIILFAGNVSTPDQIKHLCGSVQAYAISCGQPPLFIAIDQEGGQVARLKAPFTQFPGNSKMGGENDAEYFARTTAEELTRVGINMDMAPVLDVVPEGIQGVMSQRVFGNDPQWVSHLGVKVIENLQNNGVMAVAKHFPGIGRTTLDSHLDLPTLSVERKTLEFFDLLPFDAAIKRNVAGIMLSHILYTDIDPEWPASLSTEIARDLLRNRMGFRGIVITDDLDMGAIHKHYDIETVMERILSADIDIALICHKGPKIENAFERIRKGFRDSSETRAKGMESIQRIRKLKTKYLATENLRAV